MQRTTLAGLTGGESHFNAVLLACSPRACTYTHCTQQRSKAAFLLSTAFPHALVQALLPHSQNTLGAVLAGCKAK